MNASFRAHSVVMGLEGQWGLKVNLEGGMKCP